MRTIRERRLSGRVLLIGDVHQEDDLLARALDWGRAHDVSRVLCTGDVADGVGDLERACALLEEAEAVVVRGNHDRWAMSDQVRDLGDAAPQAAVERCRTFLEGLPVEAYFSTALGEVLLCHGVGDNDMAQLRPGDVGYALENNEDVQALLRQRKFQFVIGGHTHQRMVRRLQATTFINVGTLRRDHEPCWAILDTDHRRITFCSSEGALEVHPTEIRGTAAQP